jgi:hypothetical protein
VVTLIWESQWFISMYTLQGKPDQHATYFQCSMRIWPSTIRISRGLHIVTFHEFTSQPGWVVRRTHLRFSPNTTTEAVCLSQAHVDGRLLGLLCSYHQHVISMFNTCLRGPTHRSLTNTSGGYNLGGAGFPHTTPQPYQPTVLRFPPKGPAWS